MKLVSAKCPSCGANLKLSKDEEQTTCEFCHQTIIVDDAIKMKLTGTVSVDGITTNKDLINAANELLDMGEYLKAKKKFSEYCEKKPNDYHGWLGLLICRTRNFTVRDNNIMFRNDVENYCEHFMKTAPEDVRGEYAPIINNYLHPEPLDPKAQKEKRRKEAGGLNINKDIVIAIVMIIFALSALSAAPLFGIIALAAGIVYIPNLRDKITIADDSKKKKIILIVYIVSIILCFMISG